MGRLAAERADELSNVLKQQAAQHIISDDLLGNIVVERKGEDIEPEKVSLESLPQLLHSLNSMSVKFGLVEPEQSIKIGVPNAKIPLSFSSLDFGSANVQITDANVCEMKTAQDHAALTNCNVGHLLVAGHRIVIRHCKIGTLTLKAGSELGDIVIENSHVCELELPPPDQISLRNFIILDTTFSRQDTELSNFETFVGHLPRVDRQSFSNLVTWGESNKNSQIAHLARGYELAIEQGQSSGLDWIIFAVWKFYSDFGLRPQKALGLLLVGLILSSLALFGFGTELGANNLSGWQVALQGDPKIDQLYDDFNRAVVGAFQATLFPWSIFDPGRLVIPANGGGLFVQVAQSINSVLAILFAGFSIRRRFRMS